MTNAQKGDRLEEAVSMIESAIIKSSPGFAEANFQIESKKIISVQGVRHEIDLWVTARIAAGYESIFIFECRNRTEKVSKNDIIVFSEKVKVTNASRGFFVAKAFTADALAQSSLDPRLQPLVATELDPSSIEIPQMAPRTRLQDVRDYVGIRTTQGYPLAAYIDSLPFSWRDQRMPIGKFMAQLCRESQDVFPVATLPAGEYPFVLEANMYFEKYEAFLAGVELTSLTLLLEGVAVVERAKLISAFDIQSRGRAIRYHFEEPIMLPEGVVMQMGPVDITITPSSP